MNLFLLELYDKLYWERRPAPGGVLPELIQKSNQLEPIRRESQEREKQMVYPPRWLEWVMSLNKIGIIQLIRLHNSSTICRAIYPAWEKHDYSKLVKIAFAPPDNTLFEWHTFGLEFFKEREPD